MAKVELYQLAWNTKNKVGSIKIKLEGRNWASWRHFSFEEYSAISQILQSNEEVYAKDGVIHTGPDAPGDEWTNP